ncbi:MAG: N-acetyltransferase [Chitinophagaceae bacterium]|nr:MAG: N-acetyltransferase [Chitinophagaceae bacterium]
MLQLNFNPFPVLHTSRLLLRQLEESDVDEVFALYSNKEVMKYLDRPLTRFREEAFHFIQKILNQIKSNESILWAITQPTDFKLIGTICFWHIQTENYRAEIGYVLHPDYQHKGIMREAITVVLDYGFNIMRLHSVEANVNPANAASIRLLEKNNFVREGYFKENYFFNNQFLDSAIYSLLAPKQ